MSAPTRRSRIVDVPSRAVVWIVGFLLTGYVFHDLTAADLQRLGVRDAAYLLGSFAAVLVAVGYLAFVVPRPYALGLVAVVGYLLALRASMFAVQRLGVAILEARQ